MSDKFRDWLHQQPTWFASLIMALMVLSVVGAFAACAAIFSVLHWGFTVLFVVCLFWGMFYLMIRE